MLRHVLLLCLSLLLAACHPESPDQDPSAAPAPTTDRQSQPSADWVSTLLTHARVAHEELLGAAEQLQQRVDEFLAKPDPGRLKLARDAWRAAHQAYKSTLFYMHLGVLNPQWDISHSQPLQHALDIRIDRAPLEPGYLDYVQGYPFSGLVFAESIALTPDSLNEQHQFGDTHYVTLGFHALEFLLWGENLNQETRRPWQDYELVRTARPTQREAARARRRQLLQLVTQLLMQDLRLRTSGWMSGGFYANSILHGDPSQQVPAVTEAMRRSLHLDLLPALKQVLKQNSAADADLALESQFSHNGKADLLATLRPIKWILVDHEHQPPSSAVALALSPAQREQLAEQQVKLRQSLRKASEALFDPGHHASDAELNPLQDADNAAVAMLKLLLDSAPDVAAPSSPPQ